MQGGIGPCGRDLCCATFLKDFEPVSIRMAKDQDLPLNPLKISGACGRLMCCLKYEHPLYQEFKADLPALGSQVETDEGDGRLVGYNVPAGNVVVRLSASGERRTCSKAERLRLAHRVRGTRRVTRRGLALVAASLVLATGVRSGPDLGARARRRPLRLGRRLA